MTPDELRAALLRALTTERFTHVPQAPAGPLPGPTRELMLAEQVRRIGSPA